MEAKKKSRRCRKKLSWIRSESDIYSHSTSVETIIEKIPDFVEKIPDFVLDVIFMSLKCCPIIY